MSDTVTPVHLALGAVLLAMAVAAMFARARAHMALFFLAFGAVLSAVWAVVGSADVALAEASLGAGVMGALVVAMVTGSPHRFPCRSSPESPPRTLAVLALAVLAATTLAVGTSASLTSALGERPRWSESLQANLPDSGFDHGVTAVLLNFRAYDTLLESFVVLLAAVAVTALAGWHDGPPAATRARLPTTYPWFVRLAAPTLLVLSGWVLFAGTSRAGGAFQAGAVLAGLLILLRHSPGDPTRRLRHLLPVALSSGVLVFVAAAALGPLTGRPWLSFDPAWVGPTLVAVEVFLTVGIAVALFTLYLCLAGAPRERADHDEIPGRAPTDPGRRRRPARPDGAAG